MTSLWRLAILQAVIVSLTLAPGAVRAQSTFPDRPGFTDPVSRDAIDLFSRLCIVTRADRARAATIVGNGDTAVEPMKDDMLNALHGAPGGVGWVIRMPLGERILVDFAPDGSCIVRVPRVAPVAVETEMARLLDRISASGQFKFRKTTDTVRTLENIKYHVIGYSVTLPDSERRGEIVLNTTADQVFIQGTLALHLSPGQP